MSESKTSSRPDLTCPACGNKGKKVKLVTLQSLLKPEAATVIGEGPYRFCDSIDCLTVYFGEDGRTFSKDDLTVRVGVKERTPPRHVCYCFDHTIEEIDNEVRQTGTSTVLDDIKTRMKDACWCETKSPLGSCCLSTVGKYVKASLAAHGSGESSDAIEQPHEDCCAPGGHSSEAMATVANGSKMRRTWNAGKTAQVGTVVSAVLASACCWLPLLLIAFGVSGVAVSATLAEYRPVFVTLTFIFLGGAFYFTYRPRPAAAEGTNRSMDCCEVTDGGESCCSPEGVKRLGMQKLNKATLWAVTVIALAFVFFPNYIGSFMGGSNPAVASGAVDVMEVQVEGMTCEACAVHIQSELAKVPGVTGASVSYSEGRATVTTDTSSPPSRDSLIKAVERAGYKVTGEMNQP